MNSRIHVPPTVNEPVFSYAPGSPERAELKATLEVAASTEVEIPLIIAGEEVRTGDVAQVVMPHAHGHVLATYHKAGPAEVRRAIDASLVAHEEWSRWPFEDRARIFLRAAELLATDWRQTLNADTMLGQSKTCYQAEIDAACELVDFLRFNVEFAEELYSQQPESGPGVWNSVEYRPLEGFVYAISPFNFTAIGGNLTGAPALLGNTVVWKPSDSAVLSNYRTMRLFEAAGLPAGVINFIPGDPVGVTDVVLDHPKFAGLHFTGSTSVFRDLWRTVGEKIGTYRSYPRLVGETGGKDFVLAHSSANPDVVRTALVRGAFEFQGQKCSAASRAYIPQSIWEQMSQDLIDETESLKMGDPRDFSNFMGAVIHRRSFDKISGYLDRARNAPDAEIIAGGQVDDSTGYFVRPAIIQASDPKYESVCEEIFGPVLSVVVYPDAEWEETLQLVESTSEYALTGAIIADDASVVMQARDELRYAAGNFYINDKPTGAVVGQQPFGGSRASGTDDKAGSIMNLYRWVSPRTLKETLVPDTEYAYPYMDES